MNTIRNSLLLISLGSVCAFASVSDISSMQESPEGWYNVVCKNGTYESVSAMDVTSDTVCTTTTGTTLPGMYRSDNGTLCDMTLSTTLNGSNITDIRLDYPGCTGEYLAATCVANICTGVSAGQTVKVTLQDATHYYWENQDVTSSYSGFTRIGDKTFKTRNVRRTKVTGAAGAAGAL